MGFQHGCCSQGEANLSKFDYRRFLPASERKKQLHIGTSEELWRFHAKLIKELIHDGEDVSGFVDHMNYISEMASTGIYDIKALVAYDEEMLERARGGGAAAFSGADTHLTNTKLGMAGTKAARGSSGAGQPGRSSNSNSRPSNRGGQNSRNGDSGKSPASGWRKLAAEKGVCFRFSQDIRCDGCTFKHVCVFCDATSHCMVDCKSNSARASDNKG